MLLEVIATCAEDCATAAAAGADRIELCCALELGGLTPSLGLVQAARAATQLPLMVMVRPRMGGFCYSAREFDVMQRDAAALLAAGADGLVCGFLHADGAVDAARTAAFVRLAEGRSLVFHRAFDLTPDPYTALAQLIDLGVTRLLTSGQVTSAVAGAALIRQLVDQAGDRIQILPGGGITPANVVELLRRTGAQQVHASCSGQATDPSTARRPHLHFGLSAATAGAVRILDARVVTAMRAALAGMADAL